jgi:hypothetical protein
MDVDLLNEKLDRAGLATAAILARVRFYNDADRIAPDFSATNYLPFYYHLGQQLRPSRMLFAGLGDGYTASAFLAGCTTLEGFTAFQAVTPAFYGNIGRQNVREYFKGRFEFIYGDDSKLDELLARKGWDLVVFAAGASIPQLQKTWENLETDALIAVDRLTADLHTSSLQEFADLHKRTPVLFKTRFGLGILQR